MLERARYVKLNKQATWTTVEVRARKCVMASKDDNRQYRQKFSVCAWRAAN